jgi:hypothetical protein
MQSLGALDIHQVYKIFTHSLLYKTKYFKLSADLPESTSDKSIKLNLKNLVTFQIDNT